MTPTSWYYARNGQQLGPVTLDALRQQASSGELKPGDLVWGEGMPDWVDARQVPQLAGSFALAPDEGEYDIAAGQGAPPAAPAAPAYPSPYQQAPYQPPQYAPG